MKLHGTVGPARTTVSAIADEAGVQRATVYRHFPDDQSLFDACTAHFYGLHPRPDPEAWASIADPDERLRKALADLYAWYGETEEMLSNDHARCRARAGAHAGALPRLLRGGARGADPGAPRARTPASPCGRGNRPRDRVSHLALAGPRAGARRCRGGRVDGGHGRRGGDASSARLTSVRASAEETMRPISSSNPTPAASAAIGRSEVSVSPGMALASRTCGVESRSRIRSTRANPVHQRAS